MAVPVEAVANVMVAPYAAKAVSAPPAMPAAEPVASEAAKLSSLVRSCRVSFEPLSVPSWIDDSSLAFLIIRK